MNQWSVELTVAAARAVKEAMAAHPLSSREMVSESISHSIGVVIRQEQTWTARAAKMEKSLRETLLKDRKKTHAAIFVAKGVSRETAETVVARTIAFVAESMPA